MHLCPAKYKLAFYMVTADYIIVYFLFVDHFMILSVIKKGKKCCVNIHLILSSRNMLENSLTTSHFRRKQNFRRIVPSAGNLPFLLYHATSEGHLHIVLELIFSI